MAKFKVGDRVRYVRQQELNRQFDGARGTIREVGDFCYYFEEGNVTISEADRVGGNYELESIGSNSPLQLREVIVAGSYRLFNVDKVSGQFVWISWKTTCLDSEKLRDIAQQFTRMADFFDRSSNASEEEIHG